ncbi:hypothetical protein GCM10010342_42370 [Streptomyces anulatus]|nr:hypothetical protein GCM10010342_42370 [Streptomyces anulatus]
MRGAGTGGGAGAEGADTGDARRHHWGITEDAAAGSTTSAGDAAEIDVEALHQKTIDCHGRCSSTALRAGTRFRQGVRRPGTGVWNARRSVEEWAGNPARTSLELIFTSLQPFRHTGAL